MLQAYVGIVSRRGIEVFCLEHPETQRFLFRRARRSGGHAACFWCVLADDAAKHVRITLRFGQPQRAFDFLQMNARDIGLLTVDDEQTNNRVRDKLAG
jgi:hypothetical protein